MAEEKENTHTCSGLLSSDGKFVPLKSIKVDVNITGYVAEVTSSLIYFNEEKDPVEAVFTFPVDDGSAVFQFEAEIDGRHIVAEIQEKEQARLTYQDAVDHGKTAMLLKEDNSAGDIFSCMLGNLPPESWASLLMKYVIELPQEADGRLRFTLPSVLNPRYSPGDFGCTLAEGATYVPPCKIPYIFNMMATVHGYHKVISVTSYKDSLTVQHCENNTVKVSLSEDFKFDHDLSFIVQYEKPFTPQFVLEKGNPEADGMMKEDILMISFHPGLKEVTMATNGEYIFFIDRSGSMGGDKIKNAKEALQLFLKSLPSDSYFNVVSFGSDYSLLFPLGSKPYTEENLYKAVALSKGIEANMNSTQILKALNNVLEMELIEGHPKRVFLLTDGEVTNKNEVIALVRKYTQNTDTRIYTLGLGEGVSTFLVKGIASNGGGIAEFTQGNDDIQSKVMHLLKCAMQPSIRDVTVSLTLPQGVTYITLPTEFPSSISVGEKLTVYAILQGVVSEHSSEECSVTLEGCDNGVPVSYKMTFTLDKGKDTCTSAPVHRLATKAQIKLLEDKESVDWFEYRLTADITADQRQKIIAVSCYGNIVSRYTAFVAIDTKGEKVKGKSQTRSCPVPLMTMDYMDGMYDLDLKQQGVTDRNMFAAAVRAQSVQRMKLSKHNCLYEEERARKDCESKCGLSRKKRLRFHVKLPKLAGLFSKWKKRLSSKSNGNFNQAGATGRSHGAEGSSESGYIGATVNMDKTYEKQSEEMMAILLPDDGMIPAERMMEVIELQLLLGQWEVSDPLLKLMDIDKEDLYKLNFLGDSMIVCTVVAVCWLRKWFPHRKEELKMIEMKALTWLAKQNLPLPTEDIIQQATFALWP